MRMRRDDPYDTVNVTVTFMRMDQPPFVPSLPVPGTTVTFKIFPSFDFVREMKASNKRLSEAQRKDR